MIKDILITNVEKKALINYLSGTLNKSDSNILNNWLGKDNKNKLLFDQFTDVWQASYYKKTSEQINIEQAWNELKSRITIKDINSRTIFWKEIIKVAAIFVFAVIIGGLGYYFFDINSENKTELSCVEYVSPLGSRSFVKLADGSKVWLNAGTIIKYQNSFGTNNREIILKGEAFFEVEKNKDLPFIVKTTDIDIIAIGTKFNVKAYPEEKIIETTLIEGSVQLQCNSVILQNILILKPNEKAVFTKPNQSLDLQPLTQKKIIAEVKTTPKLEIIKSVNPEPIVSWKEKQWIINNQKLGEFTIELGRRYAVNFIFDNEILKEYSFGGTLENETLEQVMEAISYTAPIKYVIDKKTVYIMADGEQIEKFKKLLMK